MANGDTRVEPGRVEAPTVTIQCRYEDWVDLLGGREHPLKLAATRRLRPKGDLRWLWRARGACSLRDGSRGLAPPKIASRSAAAGIIARCARASGPERRTTELLQRLIRFPTVNPPGNEGAAQEWLRGLLEPAGFECELLAAVPGRPNLIARLRSGSDGPALCLLGHVDTVLADPAEWSVDPWSGEVRDGCVWGRGAIDMKSQVAAEVAAALALVEEGWRPEAGELMLVFTADEETGAAEGAQWLCREHPDRVRADMVVNEGAGAVMEYDGRRVYPVCVAEKGVFRFTITTVGRAGHASLPRIGDNALAKLAPVLTALRERRPSFDLTPEPEALLAALGLDPSDPEAAFAEIEAKDPRLGLLVEPMLGITHDSHDPQRRREDQRDPVARGAAGRLPRAARSRAATRCWPPWPSWSAPTATRWSSATTWWRKPLADRHAADGLDPPLRRARGPGRDRGPDGVPRLLRLALVARGLPRLRGLRLLPPARHGRGGADLADARRRRARAGARISGWRPASTLS